jgi:S1-C subfamily serine protease
VRERYSSGLFARANVRPGDVIVSVNSRPVYSQQTLVRYFHDYRGSGPIPVVILRDGTRQTIYVDQSTDYYVNDDPDGFELQDSETAWLGVNLNARYPNSAVVQSVQPGSPAEQAGLQPNDWIVTLNEQRIMSPRHLSQVIRDMAPGDQVSLQISRRVMGELTATLTDHPDYNNESGDRPERPASYEE